MATSSSTGPRLAAFIALVAIVVLGFYAYNAHAELTAANATITSLTSQLSTSQDKLAEATKSSTSLSGEINACKLRETELTSQLTQLQESAKSHKKR
jgi:hypothetical protein